MAAEAKDEDECGWCIGSSKISGEMGLGGPNDWLGGSRKARAWPPEDGRMTPCAVGRERVPIDALEPIVALVTIGSFIFETADFACNSRDHLSSFSMRRLPVRLSA